MRAKFGVLEQTQGLHLPAKFYLSVFIVSAFGGPKNNFAQILTFLRAPVPTPCYRWGPNLVCYSRPKAYAYVPNFVLIGLFCRPLAAKNPIFLFFLELRHLVVSPIGQQSENAEHGCTTTNLPLSNDIKIVSVLQRLHHEIGRTNWRSKAWRTDRQTDKKLNVFVRLGCRWNTSPTKLGTLIEDLEHVLARLKLLGSEA